MGPDGGIEDREPLSATLPRHGASRQTETEYNQLTRERSRTPDLASYNTVAIDTEWHKYDRERRLRNETTTSKSCTELSKPLYNTEPSYLEQERNAYQQDYKSNAKVTEKNRGRFGPECGSNVIQLDRKFEHAFVLKMTCNLHA